MPALFNENWFSLSRCYRPNQGPGGRLTNMDFNEAELRAMHQAEDERLRLEWNRRVNMQIRLWFRVETTPEVPNTPETREYVRQVQDLVNLYVEESILGMNAPVIPHLPDGTEPATTATQALTTDGTRTTLQRLQESFCAVGELRSRMVSNAVFGGLAGGMFGTGVRGLIRDEYEASRESQRESISWLGSMSSMWSMKVNDPRGLVRVTDVADYGDIVSKPKPPPLVRIVIPDNYTTRRPAKKHDKRKAKRKQARASRRYNLRRK